MVPIPWKAILFIPDPLRYILFIADPPDMSSSWCQSPLVYPLHRRSPRQYVLFMVLIPWKAILFIADPLTRCPLLDADPLESNPLHRQHPR
jgi:hypothetical protein